MKSLNKSFNEDFCSELEFAICKSFANSEENEQRNYWCDGVLHAPFYNDDVNREHLSFDNIKKKKQIETSSWIGVDGQTEYKTIIHFGELSLKLYAEEKSLNKSIPNNSQEWLEIDPENKVLELFLL